MKRSVDEWDAFAKKLMPKAEQKAEESKNPGEGVGAGYVDVVREIGAVCLGEFDVKLDEAAFQCTATRSRASCWTRICLKRRGR